MLEESTIEKRAENTEAILEELSMLPNRVLENDFEERLKIQKYVYLLKLHHETKKYLNYGFSMYLRGPYSPELASDYYNKFLKTENLPKIDLSPDVNEYAKEIKKLETWELEVITTLIEVWEVNHRKITSNELIDLVHEIKSGFDKKKIKEAYKKAVKILRMVNLNLPPMLN